MPSDSCQDKGLEDIRQSDEKVYDLLIKECARISGGGEYHARLFESLAAADSQIHECIGREYDRQRDCLEFTAAANRCSRAVLAALGSVLQNKTAEGFAGCRYHGGAGVIDTIESIALDRARRLFGARYANVQPHSGSQSNQIALTALLDPGDKILSLSSEQGGHPSHGSAGTFADKFFNVKHYCVDSVSYTFNYDEIEQTALEFKPRLIMCGASAYPRKIDFARFRQIADKTGSLLLADISHLAALVIAGLHPSPIDHAHITTTSTYKAGGPRGGLILMGRDADTPVSENGRTLKDLIEKMTFPGVQGTAYFNHIAGKAVFFKEARSVEYSAVQYAVTENARILAEAFAKKGFNIISGGTDTHMVIVKVSDYRSGLTGIIAQKALEECGIVVDMYRTAYDDRPDFVGSTIRLGTGLVTKRGLGAEQIENCADMMTEVLDKIEVISETEYKLDNAFSGKIRAKIEQLCREFVIC